FRFTNIAAEGKAKALASALRRLSDLDSEMGKFATPGMAATQAGGPALDTMDARRESGAGSHPPWMAGTHPRPPPPIDWRAGPNDGVHISSEGRQPAARYRGA